MSYETPERDILAEENEGPVYYVSFAWLTFCALLLVEALIQLGAASESMQFLIRLRVIGYFGYLADTPWQLEPWRTLTYTFVHAGPLHLFVNAALFVLVGPHLCRHVGWRIWSLIWFGSGIAAAVAYGSVAGPGFVLTGASGAIFGLLGAAKMWEATEIWQAGESWQRFVVSLGIIALVGLAMSWLSGGTTGWMAPFAGFHFGVILALLMPGTRLGRLIL